MTGAIRIRSVAKVGAAIRFVREMEGLSLTELGVKAKFAPNQIAEWERGDHKPGADCLIRLFDALGYDLALIPREEP